MTTNGKAHLVYIAWTREWRHFLQKRYWVRCQGCNFQSGPYKELEEARRVARALWERSDFVRVVS